MNRFFDIAAVRAQFPSLAECDQGSPRIYLDNPAGTQVPQQVIERTIDCFRRTNANLGGFFETSRAAGSVVDEAHAAIADFYNAFSAREIIFGQNMTSLTLHLSRCLGKSLRPGDEIILSRMDHDANIAPWLLLAEDMDLTVKWMDFDPESYEFPPDALTRHLSSRTRLLAMGWASNCTGTVNDVKHFAAQAKQAGALVFIDAVQYAPHYAVDVQDLGADFVVSSAYKWFGPHQAALWGREEQLTALFAYKVRAVGEELPHKFETGTLSHEAMAGCLGAIEYLEQFGAAETRRLRLRSAWEAIIAYEQGLTQQLITGLKAMKGVEVRGLTSANALHRRVPTVSVTVEGCQPSDLAERLARDNIFVWSGHNYALEPIRRLGLMDKGGVLRIGLAHYNTADEVNLLLSRLEDMLPTSYP